MIDWLKKHTYNLSHMNYHVGWEWYPNKPKLRLSYTDYDCGIYALHIGRLYIEASWYDYKANNDILYAIHEKGPSRDIINKKNKGKNHDIRI